MNATKIATPLGELLAIGDETALYILQFSDSAAPVDAVEPGETFVTKSIREELNAYFSGKLKTFQTPIKFSGTPFQTLVWQQLIQIPYGQTRSYSQMANLIGKPTAVRALGNANGANPLTIIVPCHRVIQATSALGGYSAGVDRKRALLRLEKNG